MKKKKTPPIPARTISLCPCCKSPELICLEVDVLCTRCDWMSLEAYVNAGGMDNIVSAHNAHFPRGTTTEQRASVQIANAPQTQIMSA